MARNHSTRRVIRGRMKLASGPRGGGGGSARWLQLFGVLIGIGFIGAAVLGTVGFGVYRSYASGLQPPDQVIAGQPSGGARIYDRHGTLLYEYVDDRSGLRSPVKLKDISPYMIAATVSTEDATFWTNPGVNVKGLVRAGLETLHLRTANAATSTGGSSITQQLVKNIYIPPNERYKRSYERKLKETIYALELTNNYSKNQILEWYLNQIPYGGLYNGVEAASEGYFGKHAKDLTLAEAATLAGIPAAPVDYDPVTNPAKSLARRNEVLRLMHTREQTTVKGPDGKPVPATKIQVNGDGTSLTITNAEFYLSTLTPLNVNPQSFPIQAPHWVFNVIQPELIQRFGREALYSGGLRVTTSLDLGLEQKAQTVLDHWINQYEARTGGHNGAVVSIDPKTSEVLVYIGSRDYFNKSIQGQVDNASPQAGRSPGSSLKPFTYTAAFQQLGWGTNTEILDTPISFNDGTSVFTPTNPEHNFIGPAPVHIALGNSLNIPAFKTALYVGVPNVVDEYKKFGITGLDGHTYGPSVTIGGVDVKLYDVAYAYSVLAAGGVMRGVPTTLQLPTGNRTLDPVTILQITRQDGTVLYPNTPDHRVKVQEQRVVPPQYAYMISSILSDPKNTCLTWSCGIFDIGRPLAVKTGASQPYVNSTATADTWTYGYTPDLVTGVWFGNADNKPTYNLFSTTVAWRVVRDFMKQALVDTPPSSFARPSGLVEVDVCEPSGLKPTPSCGRVVKNLLPADKVPTQDDNWWSTVKIDIRDGLLATELTPPQFIQQRRALVIPDTVQGFARTQAEEWARILNVGVAPTQKSTGDVPVRIDTPADGDTVKGAVAITGMAQSADFLSYRLEFGAGNPPLGWTLISQSNTAQPGGALGVWTTDGLPDGTYTLRLVLTDAKRGELSTYVVVTIGKGGGGPGKPKPTPTTTPFAPAPAPGNNPD
ncbi:MAG: transglycosylase domain-containing protein [Dehalococcoidia bacterium]